MSIYVRLTLTIAAALLSLAAQRHCLAGSATWGTNPSSEDWNAAVNWIPATVPNGPSDVASFGPSNVTDVSVPSRIEVSSVNFNPGAPSFTISVHGIGINLFVSGEGIMNGSGIPQSFEANGGQSAIFFQNTATAGNLTSFGGDAPQFFFEQSASAGSANFDVNSNGTFQASMLFWDNTTAAEATITLSNGAYADLSDNTTVGNAVTSITTGAFVSFFNNATADHAVMTCIGGTTFSGSNINFAPTSSAGDGYFTAVGASTIGEVGSFIQFSGGATAANGTFVINGGAAANLAGAELLKVA